MTNIIAYIDKNPEETQRLVGLKYESLQKLIENVQVIHQQKLAEAEARKIRIIRSGGGRKVKASASLSFNPERSRRVKLAVEEQIILTLIYLRHMTTFQLLGIQFRVSETTANDTFNPERSRRVNSRTKTKKQRIVILKNLR